MKSKAYDSDAVLHDLEQKYSPENTPDPDIRALWQAVFDCWCVKQIDMKKIVVVFEDLLLLARTHYQEGEENATTTRKSPYFLIGTQKFNKAQEGGE